MRNQKSTVTAQILVERISTSFKAEIGALFKVFRKIMMGPYGIMVLFIPLVVSFAILNPRFISIPNMINIARQCAIIGILSAGMSFVILSGNIDLSVGSIVAFSGVATAFVLKAELGIFLAIISGILAGGLVGYVNGWITTKFDVPSLLVTLGTMNAIRGVAYLLLGGRPIWGLPEAFSFLGRSVVLGVPIQVWILTLVFVMGWFILKRTAMGRHIYATGDNRRAARLSGIDCKKIITLGLVISGLCAGLAGSIMVSRLASAQPLAGKDYELKVIAAVVLGGTSLFGGRGEILGSLMGALMIGMIANGLNLARVTPYWQMVLLGLILLVAIIFDKYRQSKRA